MIIYLISAISVLIFLAQPAYTRMVIRRLEALRSCDLCQIQRPKDKLIARFKFFGVYATHDGFWCPECQRRFVSAYVLYWRLGKPKVLVDTSGIWSFGSDATDAAIDAAILREQHKWDNPKPPGPVKPPHTIEF